MHNEHFNLVLVLVGLSCLLPCSDFVFIFQIAESQDFVSPRLDFSTLEKEYSQDDIYMQKIQVTEIKLFCDFKRKLVFNNQ